MRGLNIRGQAKPGENQKEQLSAAARSANVRKGIIGGVGSEGNESTYGNYNPNVQTVRQEASIDATSGKPIPAKNTYSIPSLSNYEGSITQNESTTVSKMGSKNTGSQIQAQYSNYGDADKKPSTYQGESRTETANFKPLQVGDNSGYQENYVSVTGTGNNQRKTLRNVKTNKPVGNNNGLLSDSSTGYKNKPAINKQRRDSTYTAGSRMRTQLFNELGSKMSYLAENPDRKL
tara:strand:+ start:455 stop:1153 length:699 start_codon:yes stop_codon:yes gene_type:complete